MLSRLLTPLLLAALLSACGGALGRPGSHDRPDDASEPAGRPTREGVAVDPTLGGLLGDVRAPPLVVHFIDVGQGDAVFVQTPGGKYILIDSGPPFSRGRLVRYLEDLGVHHLDLAVNTHNHADHIAGLVTVIHEMPVRRLLDGGVIHPSPFYEEMLKALEADKIPVTIARRGQTITADQGVTLNVLAPEDPLIAGSRSDANANSVVLRLDYGQVRFLFPGDAEFETEDRLLEDEKGELRAAVLKVAHHGSRYASAGPFLDAVQPKIAIISCGARNNYGHPAPETLERLREHGVEVLQTPLSGNIVVATDGEHAQVITVPRAGGAYGGWQTWVPGTVSAKAAAGGPPRKIERVDVNNATVEQLAKLPGVGPKLAARIIAYRKAQGRFRKIDDLARVKGIGKRKLERMRPHVLIVR